MGRQTHNASFADAGEGQHTRVSIPTHCTASHRRASHRSSHATRSDDATRSDEATSSDGATTRSYHASFPDILSNELGHGSCRAPTPAPRAR